MCHLLRLPLNKLFLGGRERTQTGGAQDKVLGVPKLMTELKSVLMIVSAIVNLLMSLFIITRCTFETAQLVHCFNVNEFGSC